jgi:DNA polymerase III epsilon subunit family exonuclease
VVNGVVVHNCIGKKLTHLIDAEEQKFIKCAAERKNRSKEEAKIIFALIKPAARYAWNIAHSASYSLISYVTAYLKAHFPAEYFTATMSIEHDINKISEYRGNLIVLPPDINRSEVDPTVIDSNEVRLGLSNIKGVGRRAAEMLVRRRVYGEYESADDMRSRIPTKKVNSSGVRSLWLVGALDSVGLFRDDMTDLQRWSFERQLCGTANPDLTHPLRDVDKETIEQLKHRPVHWRGSLACYIHRVHRIKTKDDKYMAFISVEDSNYHKTDIVCFPSIWGKVQRIIQVGRCMMLEIETIPDRNGNGVQFSCSGASYVLEGQGISVFSELDIPKVAQPANPDKWRDFKNSVAYDVRIAVTDIETTGLDHKNRTDKIVELASAIFCGGRIIDQKSWLINPCRLIPQEVQEIHGISDAMVVDSPIFCEIAPEWLGFIKDCVLVGHNFKSFDRHMINAEMDTAGLKMPKIPIIDTMTMVRRYDKPQDQEGPKLPTGWLKLEKACERHGISNNDAHRALSDVMATGELFYKLLSKTEKGTLVSTLVR